MNVTWDEANQIVAQMIYEESLTVDAHTQERMASVIFSHRDHTWDHNNQEWVLNGATTAQHVAELQEETEVLHRTIARLRAQIKDLNKSLNLELSSQIEAI